jgi:streptogramin lyase
MRASVFGLVVGVALGLGADGLLAHDAPGVPLSAFLHHRGRQCQAGQVQPLLSVPGGDFDRRLFEGVAVTPHGTVFTQDQCSGDVYRLRRNGAASVFANIPYGVDNDKACNKAGGLGLALSRDGSLWIAVLSWVPESHGIWRVTMDGSADLAVPMSPDEAPVPNGIAFDPRGNLWVSETLLGSIWKVTPDGEATLWFTDAILRAPEGGIFGANGIVYKDGALFTANTDAGTIVKIPIRRDGSPGKARIVTSGLNGPDGVTVDSHGDLYTVTCYGAQLVHIRPGAVPEVVVDMRAAGVSYPVSVDFLRHPYGLDTAYITNFLPEPGEPNLVKVNLCEPHHCSKR